MYRYVYINSQTYLPEKIVHVVDFMNDIQYENIEITPEFLCDSIDFAIRDSISPVFDSLYNRYLKQPQFVIPEGESYRNDSVISYAPDWALPKLTGDTFRFNEISSPLVLLDFWYVQCAPCLWAIKELVALDTLYTEDVLKIVGINVYDTTIAKIQGIVDELKIKYDVVYKGKNVANEYGCGSGFPKLFLIDTRTKKVIHYGSGYYKGMKEDLQKIINEYLLNQNEGKKN